MIYSMVIIIIIIKVTIYQSNCRKFISKIPPTRFPVAQAYV